MFNNCLTYNQQIHNKNMSHTNTEEIIKTREVVDKEGFLTKTRIVQFYSKLSYRSKYAMWGYFGGVLIHNLFSSYNVGRKALINHRLENSAVNNTTVEKQQEFEAVKSAISKNSFKRFFSSLVFPYTIASEMVPNIVVALNQK